MESAAQAGAEASRTRVRERRYVGLVIEWRGYMGWIQPLERVVHPLISKHRGRIYLNEKDIRPDDLGGWSVKEGKVVDFYVYADSDGLGADDCRPRSVLRLTLSHRDSKQLKYTPTWTKHLGESEYYPDFQQEHDVVLRKYSWSMPFALFELWGHPDELAAAALQLAQQACEGDDARQLRLVVLAGHVAKVEKLPHSPKVSAHTILTSPAPCHSVLLSDSAERCREVVRAFVLVTQGY